MPVTASLQPERSAAQPGGAVAFSLRIHNRNPTKQLVSLRPSGALADRTAIAPSAELAPDEFVDVPLTVEIPLSLPPGPHSPAVAVSIGDELVATAESTLDIAESADHVVTLSPVVSRSAAAGRHRVTIDNLGNVAVTVDLTATADDGTISLQPDLANVTVGAGERTVVEVKAIPATPLWNGPVVEHGFVVDTVGSDGRSFELHGAYEQRPRMRPWWGPALAGIPAALVVGGVIWFAFLAPWVRDTADSAAADANEQDRAALEAKIEELDAAAAEADELPLGTPSDLRLSVSADTGGSASDTFDVGSSLVWSVTDIVFQNPTGAVGTVSLMRDGDVLLESELANFRDLDFHLVAPFVFEAGSTIGITVTCDEPGPGQASCDIGTTLLGFVDQTR